MHGMCLRQGKARRETEPLGDIIDRREDFDIAALAIDDKR